MTTTAVDVVSPFPKMIGTAMAFALSLEFLLSALSSFITSHLSISLSYRYTYNFAKPKFFYNMVFVYKER